MVAPHLLIVDDDPLFLRTFARVLSRDFVVSCETSVESALDTIVAARGLDLYDVILCDLVMPGTGGRQMYGALVARRSKLATRLLILTGAVTPADDAFAAHLGPRYLSKTRNVDELKRMLRSTAQPRLTVPFAPLAVA
jgi:ActR/RegA family two-component response regulator